MELRVNEATIDAERIAREAALFDGAADPEAAARRALAVRELLLQRACALGLAEEGAAHERVAFASRADEDALIARVLEQEVKTPVPDEAACRRYYAAHPERFTSGELVEVRHILFAVTASTPVMALRDRAKAELAALRAAPAMFADKARELSNCPSGAQGGNLGQFTRGSMVPEFEAAVFGNAVTGILPELVPTRYGFHIVEVARRVPGRVAPFEAVAERAAALLATDVETSALRQYISLLAGAAQLAGVDLDAAASPLVQ